MRLILQNSSNIDLDNFCIYLIERLQQQAANTDYNIRLLNLWDDYLQVVFPDLKLNTSQIIRLYFDNQIFKQDRDNYIITVDPNIKISNIPLEQIAQTISQGTLDIRGYDIFSDIYNEIASNIDVIYSTWEASI